MATIRRTWSELSREAQADELATTFSGAAAPPNQAVIDLLDGYSAVSLVEDGENFTAYQIEDRGVVWTCGSCGDTTFFRGQSRYQSGSGIDYYEKHLPECI